LTIATALQPLVATANADATTTAATLVGDIDLLTVAQTQTLLDQINPAPYYAFGQALTDQVNLFSRLVTLRSLDYESDELKSGMWGEITSQFHIGSTPSQGSKEGIFGGTAGYDRSGSNWRVGLAFGYSSATLRNRVGPNGHNDAYMLGGYGAFHLGPVVATAQVDYDLGNFSASKVLSLGYTTTTTAATSTTAATTTTTATNTTVTASSRNHLLKATGTLGVDLNVADIKVTPFAGVDYARGAINGFTESGGDAADLTVSRLSIDRTDLLAGVDVTPNTGLFRPYVRATYRSQIGSSQSPTVSAYFDGDPSTAFTVDGTGIGRRQLDLDAGVNVVYDDGSFYLGYQGTIRNAMSDHGLHAGIRFLF
jgi:uncharacterized protein with beta-barrel porin domain